MRRAADDAAQAYRAGLAGVVRVADVVLLELPGPPAGHVQPAVVDRQIDVAREWRHGAQGLERRRQLGDFGGLGGDGDHLFASQVPFSRCHSHTEDERSATLITTPTKPHVVRGSCAGRTSSTQLVLVAEIDALEELALRQTPEIELMAERAPQEILGFPVLDHRRVAHSEVTATSSLRCHHT
jgi:hypothetical protein